MSDILNWFSNAGQDVWQWVGETNPDTWAAAAGWTTAGIAFIASIAAFKQVRVARAVREEQAQPYVVAFMEPSQADQQIIEFAVKNFGTTAAYDVRMECDRPLSRTSSDGGLGSEPVGLFDTIPVLVPGQEWRIFWDSGIERKSAGLPDRHEVTVFYDDSHGKKMKPTKAILDWSVYKSRMWVDTYGQHHSAKALREISSLMKSWKEFGGGVRVYVRDGDAKDEARRMPPGGKRRLKEVNDRVLGRQGPQNTDGSASSGNDVLEESGGAANSTESE
ncbi:hypothetical protein ACSNN9_18195 [Micromonospora sp. URMC 107]|uniref:hypothetical protein n=1 Tax=Micromonospora sp. URMC 107 TaxID=3423418 RepID=UPI003F1C464F